MPASGLDSAVHTDTKDCMICPEVSSLAFAATSQGLGFPVGPVS